MVKLENVNKYFNRRKKNEIHVIDNTSLEMAESGLVALLGPSGCGKTTLLNAIGGLDKVGSGHIYINGQKITRRTSGKIDKIRTLNVGYIFQNYNLVENMTVFDNVAIALKMTGVKNKKEIEEKVNYVLEKVGMYRYRNRYADMLSGGERQRVGIARAIVKNPAIIIADEPTGNLDSRNTIEVMNIIRSISQDKLVILVTHEEKLAEFYASRIIRLKDGKIVSDEENIHDDNLDYRMENKVYLKDIKDHKRLKSDLFDIDFYNDSQTPIKLNVVVKNGNIYIESKSETDRVEMVDHNSSIEFIDDHYRELTKEESLDNGFDIEKLQINGKRKYTSIINPLNMISKGFKKIASYSLLKKILLLGFMASAVFITYAVGNIFGVTNINDDQFVKYDKSYLTIVNKNISVDDYLAYEKNEAFDYIMPGDSNITLNLEKPEYVQLQSFTAMISGSLSDSGKLRPDDIKYGRLPENDKEIAVDVMVLEEAIEYNEAKLAGLGEPEDFLDNKVFIDHMVDRKIVGITDMGSPCIYADRDIFMYLLTMCAGNEDEMFYDEEEGSGSGSSVIDYKLVVDEAELKSGSWPDQPYEVVIDESYKYDYKIGKEIDTKVNGHKLVVCGYYKSNTLYEMYLVNDDTAKYDLIKNSTNITACPVDKEHAMSMLTESGINVKDTYNNSRDEYMKSQKDSIKAAVLMALIVLTISFIEIYLIMRASFLSRIKEVGVYRAIGVKKRDIYKMFFGEIFAITTIASMPGFAVMAYILKQLSEMSYFESMYLVNMPMLIICVILIYGFNMLFGLLPVFRTMRKRPAAILSRTDIN